MEYRPLKITVVSAEGLKNVNLFSEMDVYAEVSIAGYPASKQRTPVHKQSGTRTNWNHRMEFVVDEPYLTKPGLVILFKLKAKGFFGDKVVGSVTVAIDDLFQGNSSREDRIVEYQVHTKSGRRAKGSLKFSYCFGDKFTQQMSNHAAAYQQAAYPNKHTNEPMAAYPPAAYPNKHSNEPMTAYPPAGYQKQHSDEPVTAYPAAVPQGYPGMAYPPAGYPAQSSGYGYQAPPPQGYGGYGYPPAAPPKRNRFGGGGMGLGLGAGLLGGLLIGDMVSDIGCDMGGMDF